MNWKAPIVLLFIGLNFQLSAQRMHLELGATLGFKDEFFLRPEFAQGAAFAEFHIYDLSSFVRVSKLRLGGELCLGFEKAANYFIRFDGSSTATKTLNLNRLKNGIYFQYYFLKNARHKWDLQIGATQYFNFSPLFLDKHYGLRTWKLAGRLGVNYTYKSFITGLFYEQSLRNDYAFTQPSAMFGIRIGVIY